MALTKAHNRMIESASANVVDFGADSTGVAYSDTAIAAAIATGLNVYFPKGTYRISGRIEPAVNQTLYGDGEQLTTILADDGITAIRIETSFVSIKDMTIQCDRAASATWSSTAAKGIYAKLGPDAVGSDPTGYIQDIIIERVIVKRFYESVEINGGYFLTIRNVQTIEDNFGFIINRNLTSPYTSTTLTMDKAFARGSNNNYTPNTGSIGIQVWNTTNMTIVGCDGERYEQAALFKGIQSGNIDDFYCEYAKYGIEFHTLNGLVNLRSVYYNNVGDQYSSGGYTVRVSYGTLTYASGRFIATDNSADLATDGKMIAFGKAVDEITGVNAAEYDEIVHSNLDVTTIKAASVLRIGSAESKGSILVAGADGVADTVDVVFTPNSVADWRGVGIRLITISSRANSSADTTYHEKVLTFSFIGATDSLVAVADIDVSKPGAANVSLNTQSIASGVITVTLNATPKTGGAWNTLIVAEILPTIASGSLALSQ